MKGKYLIGILIFTIFSCNQDKKNILVINLNEHYDFKNIDTGMINEATNFAIKKADSILIDIINIEKPERNFNNTMIKLDDIAYNIGLVNRPVSLISSTNTRENIRSEANESSLKIQKYYTDLSLNQKLYDAIIEYSISNEAKSLKGYKKKYLIETIKDFERSGLGLSTETKQFVKTIQNRLSDLDILFDKNIAEYQDTLFLTDSELLGLPDDYKKNHRIKDDLYGIDLSYPSTRPFFKLAESDNARKKLRFKYNNRASKKNLDVLDSIIFNRDKLAKLLGYRSFAEFRTEDRMAKNPENVWNFEKSLLKKVRLKGENDYSRLLEIKSKRLGIKATEIQSWEYSFYNNLALKMDYDIDSEEVKKYFEFNAVTKGLFTIYQKLFNISFKEIKNPSVWHEDVLMYSVTDNETEEIAGYFYLDMFPRANKYNHAAAFSVKGSKLTSKGYHKPVTSLVCNFPKPTDEMPSLLSHSNVETYFHEFGHLVHGVLSKTNLISFSGTSVARDFVEAPSQMLENWVWDKETLKLFAFHYETGEIIPDGLIDKMILAKNLNSGIDALYQIFLGIYDFTLHDGYIPNSKRTTTDVLREVQAEVLLSPYQKGTHFQAAFGHLTGYGAGYYGYKWSEVYAQDMFSIFEQNGIMDSETGMRYKKTILEKGGEVEALELVKIFLNREPNNEAFLRSMGL